MLAARSALDALNTLVDHERSRRFHEGRVQLDLSAMEALLAALPPLPRPRVCVHVAGSEGKTSTTELVAAGLRAAGMRVGTYTSPHLRDARERVRIDGRFPGDEQLARAVDLVMRAGSRLHPSYFEAMTAVARVLFADAGVDAAVWECGLGGRLDATRLLPADACVITSISLEHTAVLGDTLEAIAREKAGILRAGRPVVLGVGVPPPARALIRTMAKELGCPLSEASGSGVDTRAWNRAAARAALESLGVAGPEVEAALASAQVAGRMQLVDGVLYDGAHTVAACKALAALLPEPVDALVFGATTGRDTRAMLAALAPRASHVVLTRTPGERGVDPAELAGVVDRATIIPDPLQALEFARARGRVLVAGSLHLVGELMPGSAS